MQILDPQLSITVSLDQGQVFHTIGTIRPNPDKKGNPPQNERSYSKAPHFV